MAGRMTIQKTLFLNKKDYETFLDFKILICDLEGLYDSDIDDLLGAVGQFIENVDVKLEED